MVHSIHVSRHTVYWVQAQVGFGRVYFLGPNRVGARAHFMRWARPILRLSRRACARANDRLASVNAGQPLIKNLSHFMKSVLYFLTNKVLKHFCINNGDQMDFFQFQIIINVLVRSFCFIYHV